MPRSGESRGQLLSGQGGRVSLRLKLGGLVSLGRSGNGSDERWRMRSLLHVDCSVAIQ